MKKIVLSVFSIFVCSSAIYAGFKNLTPYTYENTTQKSNIETTSLNPVN